MDPTMPESSARPAAGPRSPWASRVYMALVGGAAEGSAELPPPDDQEGCGLFQPPANPPAFSATRILVAFWGLPGLALIASPVLARVPAVIAWLDVLDVLVVPLWALLPLALLIAGLVQLGSAVNSGWLWRVAWVTAVAAALGAESWLYYSLDPFHADRASPAEAGTVIVAIAAAMCGVLAGARRPAFSRRRWSWRRKVVVTVATVMAVAATATGAIAVTWSGSPHLSSLGSVSAVAFSPDGKLLATGDWTGVTHLWNSRTHQVVATFTDPGAAAYVNAVAFSPDGRTLATADNNGGAYLWSIATGNRIATLTQPISPDNVNGDNDAESVAFSPDGATVAVGYYFGQIGIWNAATGRRVAALPHASSMTSAPIAFSPDGKIFTAFSGPGGSGFYLNSLATGKHLATIGQPGSSITSTAFSPDSRTLAISDNFGSTYLWNIAAGSLTASFPAPDGAYVQSVAFSPDGTILATADLDGHVYLWNIVTGRRIATLSDPSGNPPDAIAFSPDGSIIAVGDDNKNAPGTPAGVFLFKVNE